MSGWEPGDVAIVTLSNGDEVRATRTAGGRWRVWEIVYCGEHSGDLPARPLVVLDPEDRDQVREVVETFYRVRGLGEPMLAESRIDNMQAALREFAAPTPPKPDEPTGRYALVEDADGDLWLREEDRPNLPWRLAANRSGGNLRDRVGWARIPAVTVLYPGKGATS